MRCKSLIRRGLQSPMLTIPFTEGIKSRRKAIFWLLRVWNFSERMKQDNRGFSESHVQGKNKKAGPDGFCRPGQDRAPKLALS